MAFDNFPVDWKPIRRFAAEDDNFTEAGTRHYIRNAEKFGLHEAILRAGGKILISPSRWYAGLANYTERRLERERSFRRGAA